MSRFAYEITHGSTEILVIKESKVFSKGKILNFSNLIDAMVL